ncbi:hypothetical protein K8M07_04645 [Schnuerera sp. xch1]|uniref:hypothetical protein n=1 Tax=Schnuerera sp. xch1 TaxID=2874283 RepID=UPI001CBA8DB6|nr:hypothetical protein [Schnuerera sp. xch1]MBZ2174530.1 hypothetical protein [Schnuerera sp. xch1]
MKGKNTDKKAGEDRKIDKNFFREMNYEIAGEIGALDNEDMKKNKHVRNNRKQNERSKK